MKLYNSALRNKILQELNWLFRINKRYYSLWYIFCALYAFFLKQFPFYREYVDHVKNVFYEGCENRDEPKHKELTEALLLNRHFDYFNTMYERSNTAFFRKGCVKDILRRRWYGQMQQRLEATPQVWYDTVLGGVSYRFMFILW